MSNTAFRSFRLSFAGIRRRLNVARESRRRGSEARRQSRMERLREIREQKARIRDGLMASWVLEEIPQPTPEERKLFWLYHQGLSLEYLLEVQKKYWQQ